MLFITCLISGLLVQPVTAFHVAYSQSISSGTTIPFNVVKTNVGNGWNRYYHRFRAPVTGLYYFTLSFRTSYSGVHHYAGAWIMRGNVKLRFVYANRKSNINAYMPASGSVVVMLNAGELVWARRYGGYLYSDSNLFTHFVGFLIQKVN